MCLIGQSEIQSKPIRGALRGSFRLPFESDYRKVLREVSQFYMRHCLFRITRQCSSIQSYSHPMSAAASRNMTQPSHSQKAATGEEIASTTVPPKGTPSKRNSATSCLPKSLLLQRRKCPPQTLFSPTRLEQQPFWAATVWVPMLPRLLLSLLPGLSTMTRNGS